MQAFTLIFHENVGQVGETRRFQRRSAVRMFSRHLQVDNRFDPQSPFKRKRCYQEQKDNYRNIFDWLVELCDDVFALNDFRVGSSHCQNIVCDPRNERVKDARKGKSFQVDRSKLLGEYLNQLIDVTATSKIIAGCNDRSCKLNFKIRCCDMQAWEWMLDCHPFPCSKLSSRNGEFFNSNVWFGSVGSGSSCAK